MAPGNLAGRTFVAECVAAQETADGSEDVAVVRLGAEVAVAALQGPGGATAVAAVAPGAEAVDSALPAAALATEVYEGGSVPHSHIPTFAHSHSCLYKESLRNDSTGKCRMTDSP
jgi:hypothetical protein